jgi:PDZ domain-containing secreted protein
MKKQKKTNKLKIIILLSLLLVSILFISFYIKREGANFTAYLSQGPPLNIQNPYNIQKLEKESRFDFQNNLIKNNYFTKRCSH